MGKKSKTRPKNSSGKKERINVDDEISVSEGSGDDIEVGDKLTLAAIGVLSDEENDECEKSEWDAEAKALRQAIAEGKFNSLCISSKNDTKMKDKETTEKNTNNDDLEKGGGQVSLEDDCSEEEEDSDNHTSDKSIPLNKITSGEGNLKALRSVTGHLLAMKAQLPWAETFDIIPSTPLPFGNDRKDGLVIDVHDDLKREVAFYDMALEAVNEGRKKCEEFNIPFSRPEDFFAEMVKTDDHMAMVKDRLIFETKKMEAFEQRKSNRELKLRAKESHAHRIIEKAKAKKKHMQDVNDWAKNAASNRAGGGKLRDDDDDMYLNKMGIGPNKKRQRMNEKYGFGGKKGRFKQNDKSSLNDMSGYNPRGSGAMTKNSSRNNKRKGKRARDAMKARS